ncbi:acetyltransferase [Streptomyces spiroverticillatus]|uniref:Acetyltransferase n=1 Tax=Streptomyces finlayi TaxID=67296 RepID=A0A918X244_9ACTN|nr:GNAT family N-acetyltransferase [Streptomyces finlayi]GHA22696.1 acetyltransferase [Streptomyces spiroverticillatus]GHD04554.1 acetyltransferase [Streptomyces finlayi]
MILRTATRADLPAVLALVLHEHETVDPATIVVDDAYERAFRDLDADPRNELLVLEGREGEEGLVLGCLQVTYIPGLGRHGQERALLEAVRVRADRRGEGLGRELLTRAVDRARSRGCTLVQLTSNKSRTRAHGFYASLGFVRSHDGFKLAL